MHPRRSELDDEWRNIIELFFSSLYPIIDDLLLSTFSDLVISSPLLHEILHIFSRIGGRLMVKRNQTPRAWVSEPSQ